MSLRTLIAPAAIALSLLVTDAWAQTISMPVLSQVGSGLEVGSVTITLSTGAHGGVTVHVESDNPALARVSNALAAVGTTSFDVFVPNGSNSVFMWVHGMEGVTGTANITASAPGFTGATRPVTVVTPATDLSGLVTSIDILDPNDTFVVRVGLPNGGGTAVGTTQVVRAGGSLTATVTNTNAVIGRLVTTPLTGQSVTVNIAAGQSQSPTTVATGGVAFDGLAVGSTTVSGAIAGFTPMTGASVLVNVTQQSISVNAIANVGAGFMVNASGQLSASEHGGVTVHIESSNPAAALVSPNLTTPGATSIDIVLANGATSLSFAVHAIENQVGSSNIVATASAFTGGSREVLVVQPAMDLSGLVTSIDTLDPSDAFAVRVGLPNAGNTALSTLQPVRAGSPGLVATIIAFNPSVGTLITTSETDDTVQVTIAAGQSSSPSTVASGGVAFDGVAAGTTAVLGQIPGLILTTASTVNVTVTSPTMSMPALGNVGAGLMGGSSSVTLSASQHGGVTMRISSTDTTLALVSPNATTAGTRFIDVPLPNGTVTAFFIVHGVENVVGTPTITASAPGFTGASRPINIVQPALDLSGVQTPIDTIDPNDPFVARIGLPNAQNTAIASLQSLRAGGPGVTATIVSSNPAIGDLVTTPLSGGTVTVQITAGNSVSPSTVASGGVAFRPLAGGSTTVSSSIPGFIATTAASVVVTVTQPIISLAPHGDVCAGLQGNAANAQLSASQHGGVTVRIESQNPALALVSPNISTPGTPFFDTNLPNGSINVAYVVHGLEGVTGTANIVASAPGFASDTEPIDIVQPAVDISSLPNSVDIDDPDNPFVVRVGTPSGGGSQVNGLQLVRAGSPGLVATVVSSVPAVGLLAKTALTEDTVTVTIAAGASISPASVAAGGVAFHGTGVGNTLVSARIPGFFPTGAATVSVTVTDQAVIMAPIGKVGAGLQTASQTATLGIGNHGGVTVRIESSNPGVALVSPAFATTGSSFFDVFVGNGTTNVPFFVHGVDGAVASATITASAPGFASAMRLVDVVQPGVEVDLLADTLDVNDPDDPFVVRVGVPKTDLSEIELPQVIRAGGTAMIATVTSSDAGVGVLRTNAENDESVVVTIPVGQLQTAADVLSGGVAFDPVLAGTAVVSAAITGAAQLQSSASGCVVTGSPPTPVSPTPLELSLEQNVPNPFNPTTRIRFTLPGAAHASVTVFDVNGRLVATLLDRALPEGVSEVVWNGHDARGVAVSSGVYFYRLTAGPRTITKKMVLLK